VVCSFCGREVKGTVHAREGNPPFKVDYYCLLTGRPEHVLMQENTEESETREFHKLTQPEWVYCCVDCFSKKEIRDKLEDLFSSVPARE